MPWYEPLLSEPPTPEPTVRLQPLRRRAHEIARATLGEGASPAAVGAFVQALWRANVAAIRTGDPDLILPGTRLVLPGAEAA